MRVLVRGPTLLLLALLLVVASIIAVASGQLMPLVIGIGIVFAAAVTIPAIERGLGGHPLLSPVFVIGRLVTWSFYFGITFVTVTINTITAQLDRRLCMVKTWIPVLMGQGGTLGMTLHGTAPHDSSGHSFDITEADAHDRSTALSLRQGGRIGHLDHRTRAEIHHNTDAR